MKKQLLIALALTSIQFAFGQCTIVYVTSDGSPTGAGTRQDPKSIESAFSSAAAGTLIRIAADTFYLTAPLTIPSNNVIIEGGFMDENDWTKTSLQGATSIIRTVSNPEGLPNQQRLVALQAMDKTGFEVHDVTIKTDNANLPGMSTYGVYLSNCSSYKFVRCQINAGNAAPGADGTPGVAGNIGLNGQVGFAGSCNGGDCTFGSGDAGAAGGMGGAGAGSIAGGNGGTATNNAANPGVAGNAASGRNGGGGGGGGAGGDECTANNAGLGGAGGASACNAGGTAGNKGSDGDPGTDGAAGGNGTNGAAGVNGAPGPAGSEVGGFWVPGAQGNAGTDGCGGAGGGGGGGGGRQVCTVCNNGPGNGGSGGGGGGQGGTGGTGGYGGGSSFGVYSRGNGTPSNFIDCKVTAGSAGLGGVGGAGGAGGAGGTGGAKQSNCSGEIGEGGAGGNGGNGGNGGTGGNGANGISSAVELASGEAYTVLSTNYNLTGQPVIHVSYHACWGPQVTVEDTTIAQGAGVTTWSFGANANPTSGTDNPQTVVYTANGFNNIVHGTNTYRAFVYYCCESLADIMEETILDANIRIFPNPNDGQFTIDLGEEMTEFNVEIRDINGRLILSDNYFNASEVSINLDQPSGMYFVQVNFEGQMKMLRVVKQ